MCVHNIYIYVYVHSVSSLNNCYCLIYINYNLCIFSELKRRLKAEQKAKEKLEKEAAAPKKQPVAKKENEAFDATKSADISPNVNILHTYYLLLLRTFI